MKNTYCIATLIYLLNAALGSDAFFEWHWGRCPEISVRQDFNLSWYLGTWYEQAGYNTYCDDGKRRCIRANYVNNPDGGIYVENYAITSSNKTTGVNGTAVLDNPSKNEGKLTVRVKIYDWFPVNGPYWVLDTNYGKYSVVYSCSNHLFFYHTYTVWFLSRRQQLGKEEEEFFSIANKKLEAHNIKPSVIKRSSQENCQI